jgi:hypothetical protein
MRPLTLLPPQQALMLWDLLNVILQGVLFVLVVRLSNARSFRQLCLAAAIYGFFPLNMDLGNGQIDLLITVMSLLAFLCYRSGKLRLAGLLVGAAVLIKPTLAVLLVFFAVRRAWPVVLSCCATIGAGIGVSAVAVGLPVLWEYRTVAAGWANAFGVLPLNQSLHGVVARLVSPARDVPAIGSRGLVSFAAEIILPLLAAVIIWRLTHGGEPASVRKGALQFYAVFTILLLASPFTENIHFTWVVPGAGLLLVVMSQEPRWRPWLAVAIVTYLVLALPFTEYLCWQAGTSLVGRLTSGMECYGLVALCCILCMTGFRALPATSRRPRISRRLSPLRV